MFKVTYNHFEDFKMYISPLFDLLDLIFNDAIRVEKIIAVFKSILNKPIPKLVSDPETQNVDREKFEFEMIKYFNAIKSKICFDGKKIAKDESRNKYYVLIVTAISLSFLSLQIPTIFREFLQSYLDEISNYPTEDGIDEIIDNLPLIDADMTVPHITTRALTFNEREMPILPPSKHRSINFVREDYINTPDDTFSEYESNIQRTPTDLSKIGIFPYYTDLS